MLLLVGFLLLVLFAATVLVRAVLLLPLRGLRHGWHAAVRRYGLSLLLCAGVMLWQLGALYGFSWQQLGRADRQQMVDAAVAFAYPEAYQNLEQLRRDFSHFRPQVGYWDNWNYEGSNGLLDKLLGDTHYQIRLPDLVVIADVHGQPLSHFPLDREQGPVAADRPELGLVGEIRDERQAKAVDDQPRLRWSQPQRGEAELHGECFSAYSGQARHLTLELSADGAAPLQLAQPPGFYRVQVQLVPHDGYRLSYAYPQRITRAEFLRLRNECRSAARQR